MSNPDNLDPLLGLGWHFRLAMPVYLADPGVSSSILKLQEDAPALAKAAMDGDLENNDTKASIEGELIHTALLEPDELKERYVISGTCAKLISSGKRKGQPCGATGKAVDPEVGWVCGQHGANNLEKKKDSRVVVNSFQWRMAIQLRDNALVEGRPLHHPDAKKLLEAKGEPELTGIFNDPETGERGRIRIDRWLELGWSIDVKTVDVGRGSADRFVRHAWNMGMHVQQGWYGHGSGVLQRPLTRHVIMVAERGFPYLVQPYLLPPALVDYGRIRALESLRALSECRRSGHWPGYSDQVEELQLLGWQKAVLAHLPDEPGAEAPDKPPMDFGIW